MLDWNPNPAPDITELHRRISRLVMSIADTKTVRNVPLEIGENLVAHGVRTRPSAVFVQLVGDAAGEAITTRGEIGATHVRIYSTAVATVDLLVVL
jgi:hypothetical protein